VETRRVVSPKSRPGCGDARDKPGGRPKLGAEGNMKIKTRRKMNEISQAMEKIDREIKELRRKYPFTTDHNLKIILNRAKKETWKSITKLGKEYFKERLCRTSVK